MPTRRAGLYFQSRLLLFLQHVRLGKPLAPLGSCAHAFVYTFTPFQNVLFTGPFCLHGLPMGKRGRTVFTFVPQVTLLVDSLCLPSMHPHFRKGSQVQPAPGTTQGTQLFHGGAGGTRLQTCSPRALTAPEWHHAGSTAQDQPALLPTRAGSGGEGSLGLTSWGRPPCNDPSSSSST